VLERLDTGGLPPYATRTSETIGLSLGGASSLLLLAPLSLGTPLVPTALVVSALASIASLCLVYDLGRLLHSRTAGLVAKVVFMVLQDTGPRTREFIFLVPLMLLSLDIAIRTYRSRRDLGYIPLAITLGLMMNTHYQGLLLTAATLAALAMACPEPPPARASTVLAVAGVLLVFAATPLMALSQVHFSARLPGHDLWLGVDVVEGKPGMEHQLEQQVVDRR